MGDLNDCTCVSHVFPAFPTLLQPFLAMGPFGWYFTLVWTLGGALILAQEAMHEPLEAGTINALSLRDNAFLHTEGACDVLWTSWPGVQERAIADGTVMVWDMKTSVGNLMRTLTFILPVSKPPGTLSLSTSSLER